MTRGQGGDVGVGVEVGVGTEVGIGAEVGAGAGAEVGVDVDVRILDEIAGLFAEQGAGEYLGEAVTMAEHMLQAAAIALAEGAGEHLVAAALLHDIGHFHGALSGRDLMAGEDNRHSHTGADWLATWFGPEVTEPIRLHVAAKRYLCAVEPGYAARLSEASVYTLGVQGGPMGEAEARAFAGGPYADDAVRLRRWDEAAKDASAVGPGFEAFRPLLTRLLLP